jgi:hypothetical protein
LRKALAASPTAEARQRLEKLLERTEEPASSPEGLRILRAVAVLDHIDSPAARSVLEAVAGVLAEARRTQDAKAALDRCKRKNRSIP